MSITAPRNRTEGLTRPSLEEISRPRRLETRLPLVALLVVQIALGYEWLMSGLTKFVRGGFPSGLAPDLRDLSTGASSWYRAFLKAAIIPHAVVFGWLIESTELVVGLVLIVAAVLWIWRWDRLSTGSRSTLLLAVAVASLAGIAMNVNFHLANGTPHPWLIPKDGFDESVDLDSLMPVIQLVLIFVTGWLWLSLRRRPGQDSVRAAGAH